MDNIIGRRVLVGDHTGTIRFRGALEGLSGLFYGIEWDDPSRGKHSGTFKSSQIFTTTIPNSASFIPVTRNINFGCGFIEALQAKYSGAAEDSTILLGDTNLTVKTVGWEKMSKKLCNLSELKDVFLAGYSIANLGAGPGTVASTCPSIQDLDLSKNLFRSWKEISEIICELSQLHTLRLNSSRLLLDQPDHAPFTKLNILTLSNSHVKFEDLYQIMKWFPGVSELHLASNSITAIPVIETPELFKNLKVLNLEHNMLEWTQVLNLGVLKLKTLVLNSNKIISITKVIDNTFSSLTAINLNNNPIQSWSDIDCLNFFPVLTHVRIAHIPLLESMRFTQKHTALIARLLKVTKVNGISISSRERFDAELYYLNQCALIRDDPNFHESHPNYKTLCEKHGEPERIIVKDSMLQLKFSNDSKIVEKKVNPGTKIRAVKTMVARLLYPQKWQGIISGECPLLWMHEGVVEELNDPMKELSSYGVTSGDSLVLKHSE